MHILCGQARQVCVCVCTYVIAAANTLSCAAKGAFKCHKYARQACKRSHTDSVTSALQKEQDAHVTADREQQPHSPWVIVHDRGGTHVHAGTQGPVRAPALFRCHRVFTPGVCVCCVWACMHSCVLGFSAATAYSCFPCRCTSSRAQSAAHPHSLTNTHT